jgi:branched-chain amino acid transport system permease protein
VIVALRDQTGGSLGATPNTALAQGNTWSLGALQFSEKVVWFYIILVVWLGGLWVWARIDRSMTRLALEAISQEEDAAASVGINVTKTKLFVTLVSGVMTSLGGVLYAQYQLYINPETVSGIGISLQMVFGVIAGGMYVMLGPTVGAVFTLLLGGRLAARARRALQAVPGARPRDLRLLLVLFIIYLPKGILGAALDAWRRPEATPAIRTG